MKLATAHAARPIGPGRRFYPLCLLHTAWVVFLIVALQIDAFAGGSVGVRAALAAKIGLEIVFAYFLVATLLKCVDHAAVRRTRPRDPDHPDGRSVGAAEAGRDPVPGPEPPPVAVIYLCCGDLEEAALRSLAGIVTGGEVEIYVHDDEGRGSPSPEVRAAVSRVERETGRKVALLSRPVREGGKPGAVNHVLERIPRRFELVLFADSDSYALSSRHLPAAIARFEDPRLGAVQFRNTGVGGEDDGPVTRTLLEAIDLFDVFASHQARHGFMPFLGHNALVRLEALREVGGLTPGMLSDDIDVSVRLALRGWRIEYERAVVFGETVPPSYRAFRARARKWAVGCTQVLRRHLRQVLRSRVLTWRQKFGFLEFAGFYVLQVSVILYLALSHFVLPLLRPAEAAPALLPAFLAGSAVGLAILAPALCHAGTTRGVRLGFAWRCALAYGSLALATAHGVIEGIVRGGTDWVPTARAGAGATLPRTVPLEVAFGLALFLIPLFHMPALLAMPSTYLFVAVYLAVPIVAFVYRPGPVGRSRSARAAALAAGALSLALGTFAGLAFGVDPSEGSRLGVGGAEAPVAVRDGRLLVEGRPFLVKGIHYSPYRPGTGPRHGGWPAAEAIESDFRWLEDLGVNTLLVHDAPRSLLDRAQQSGLRVIYAFTVNWQTVHDDAEFEALRTHVTETARSQAGHPALLYYLIGNEVPSWVVEQRGANFIEERLRSLADAVRDGNPAALSSHANWPVTKDLALPFLDIVSFNLYANWPREVAVKGYRPYIREVLHPITDGRPLVITEFGQNSLEAGEQRQAEILESCWSAVEAESQGGVVFSFVDEWWKNYDNPIRDGDYWEREYAPDDHLAHDLDPEEYYGILTTDRRPKPAYGTVRRFFRGNAGEERSPVAGTSRWVFLTLFGAAIMYTLYAFWPRGRKEVP